MVTAYDVECIDAHAVRERYPHQRLHGWELKPYAMPNRGIRVNREDDRRGGAAAVAMLAAGFGA